MRPIKIFGIGDTPGIATQVAHQWDQAPSLLHEETFPDGEYKIHPTEEVHGADCYVFQSFYHGDAHSIHDRLCQACFLSQVLRDQGAFRVTLASPYFAYGRADRRVSPRDPLTLRYVAQMLEASGVDRVIALDVHNLSAFENAFRIPTQTLEAAPLFVHHIQEQIPSPEELVVLSPDIGGIKRAERFRERLAAELHITADSAFMEKYRTTKGLRGHFLVGDVRDRMVLIYDDMISTGGTVARTIEACQMAKSGSIFVLATHILLKQRDWFSQFPNIHFAVTDSRPISHRGSTNLSVLPCAPLFVEALARSG